MRMEKAFSNKTVYTPTYALMSTLSSSCAASVMVDETLIA